MREIFLREMKAVRDAGAVGHHRQSGELAGAARVHLREKFLRAKVAVSGANFAIAETGTLVVVESEGNGRMCLTLPETLISVVGIEKTLPTVADLEVFLRLLPRSLHRRADEPVHLDVDRRHTRRRTAERARRAARQRPDRTCWPTPSDGRRCAASAARRA